MVLTPFLSPLTLKCLTVGENNRDLCINDYVRDGDG